MPAHWGLSCIPPGTPHHPFGRELSQPPLGASGWPLAPCSASHGQGGHWPSPSQRRKEQLEWSHLKLNPQEKLFPDSQGRGVPLGRGVRSPVLLGVVDYGPDLQLPVDLRSPKFLQFHLLGKKGDGREPWSQSMFPMWRETQVGTCPGQPFPTEMPLKAGAMGDQPCGSRLLLRMARGGEGRGARPGGPHSGLPPDLRQQRAIDGALTVTGCCCVEPGWKPGGESQMPDPEKPN